MLSLLLSTLLLPLGQTDEPKALPSWRWADVDGDPAQMAQLKKLNVLELNDAMALDDEKALHLKREDVEKSWFDTFKADKCKVVEFGTSTESASSKGLLTTTLWSQPGLRDGEWIVLIDTSIDDNDGHSL